ncbi:MAG: hypothetical protein LBJ14_10010 [Desulfarculales bacterium]|jgi:hypothetical protein|nr:hypothetical protein [Desulfarculales bacterium]
MSAVTATVVLFVLLLVFLVSRVGYRRLSRERKMADDALQAAKDKYGDGLEMLSKVSFHGGLGDKNAIMMRLGLVEKGIVLFDDFGFMVEIPCSRWKKQDSFIASQKQHSPFKSVVLLGPFAHTLFRDKYRHVITIDYVDENGKEDTLILEAPNINTYNMIVTALRVHKEEYTARYRQPPARGKGRLRGRNREEEKIRKREEFKERIENPS